MWFVAVIKLGICFLDDIVSGVKCLFPEPILQVWERKIVTRGYFWRIWRMREQFVAQFMYFLQRKMHMCAAMYCPGGKEIFSWPNEVCFFFGSSLNRPNKLIPVIFAIDYCLFMKVVNMDYTTCIPKNGRHNFIGWKTHLSLFRHRFTLRITQETSCFDACSVFGVLWWIYVSSAVTKRCKNSSILRLNNVKHSCEIVTRFRLWSLVIIQNWNHWAMWDVYGFQNPLLSISDQLEPYRDSLH
jgi:hypothetical protein